jgi:hypothetical protein
VHTHARAHTHMQKHTQTDTHTCTHSLTYTQTQTHTHTHTHTHTRKHTRKNMFFRPSNSRRFVAQCAPCRCRTVTCRWPVSARPEGRDEGKRGRQRRAGREEAGEGREGGEEEGEESRTTLRRARGSPRCLGHPRRYLGMLAQRWPVLPPEELPPVPGGRPMPGRKCWPVPR